MSAWFNNLLLIICDVLAFHWQRRGRRRLRCHCCGDYLVEFLSRVWKSVANQTHVCLPLSSSGGCGDISGGGSLMWSRGDLLKHLPSLPGIKAHTFLAPLLPPHKKKKQFQHKQKHRQSALSECYASMEMFKDNILHLMRSSNIWKMFYFLSTRLGKVLVQNYMPVFSHTVLHGVFTCGACVWGAPRNLSWSHKWLADSEAGTVAFRVLIASSCIFRLCFVHLWDSCKTWIGGYHLLLKMVIKLHLFYMLFTYSPTNHYQLQIVPPRTLVCKRGI